MYGAAGVKAIFVRAYIPVGPARERWRTFDAGSVCLEKVEVVDWAMFYSASEEDEEHEKKGAGGEEDGEGREETSAGHCDVDGLVFTIGGGCRTCSERVVSIKTGC